MMVSPQWCYEECLKGKSAKPFHLRIEGPMDCDVELVADEWCNTLEDIKLFADHKAGHMVQIKTPDLGGINNTIEAVLYCKEKGHRRIPGRHL